MEGKIARKEHFSTELNNRVRVVRAQHREVSASAELLAAIGDAAVSRITVLENMTELPTLRLLPGQALVGGHP